MTSTIIRYDKLYSRNEAIVLFHGSAVEAQSLDGILKGLSGKPVVGWRMHGQELIRPTAMEASIDSHAVPDLLLTPGQATKMYTVDLERVATDAVASRAYVLFPFELREAVNSQIEGINITDMLPVLVEADTKDQAKQEWEQQKKVLLRFQRRPDLRDLEISIYLEGFFNLAAKAEPPKYVFELKKV